MQLSLECCSYDYDCVYVYIDKYNIVSAKTIEACGFSICGELDIVCFYRKLVEKRRGEGTYNIYWKMKKKRA